MIIFEFVMKVVHRFLVSVETAQGSQRLYVLLVYFSILLDNLLLTAVVPVIPDFLVSLHGHDKTYDDCSMIVDDITSGNQSVCLDNQSHPQSPTSTNRSLAYMVKDHHLAINGRSMALLTHFHPDLDTENGQVGAILSSKAFVQLAFNPIVSLVINLLGYELTMILGVAILLQSSVLYLVGQSFIMLLVPRALQGIGSALINVAGMSMMANMFRDEEMRLATIGFCLGGMAAGVLIGYPFGGLVYQWFGKSVLFYILIGLILIILSTQLITFNWSPTNAPVHYDSKAIFIITNHNVLLAILIIGISTVTMSLLESFLPLWLIKEISPPKWKLGVVFIPDSIGYLIGTNIFTLFYISLKHRWFLVTMALLIIGTSAFLVPLVPNLIYLILPHFGIGLGIGIIDSALMPLLAELVDEQFAAQYGYVYAAVQTAASAAYAFGPLIGGLLLNRKYLSFQSLMYLVGGANLCLCLLAFWLKHKKRLPTGCCGHCIRSSLSSISNTDDDYDYDHGPKEQQKVSIKMENIALNTGNIYEYQRIH